MPSASQQQRSAAQLVNAEFPKLYAEFVKHHSTNAYTEIIRLIPAIPVAQLDRNYAKHYASLIGRCLSALHRCPPSTSTSTATTHPSQLAAHLCSAYAYLFSLQSTLPHFFTAVAALDPLSSSFRSVLSTGDSPHHLTLAETILARLDQLLPADASQSATLEAQHSAIYGCLLLLVKLEMSPEKPAPKLSITPRAIALLKRCLPAAGCDLRKCLNLGLLMVLGSAGWCAHLGAWVRRFEAAAEVPDELQLHTLHAAVQMLHTLRVVGRLKEPAEVLAVLQFVGGAQAFFARVAEASEAAEAAELPAPPRSSCPNCAANWAAHESVALAELGAQLLLSLLPVKAAEEKVQGQEDDQLVRFYPILLRGCGAARQLRRCPNAEFWAKRARRWVLVFPSELQRLQPQPQPWIWRFMRACCEGTRLLGVEAITELWPAEGLCNLLELAAPDAEALLAVLYMHLAFQLSAVTEGGGAERLVAQIVQRILQAQARRATIWDPDEYFGAVGWLWSGLVVPRLEAGELLLPVFEMCTLRTNPMSAEQRQQLAMHMLERLTAQRPLQALRVSNCFAGYAVAEEVFGGLQRAYAAAKQRQAEYARNADHKRRWYSCVANMEAIEYLHAQQDLRTRILAEPPSAFDFKPSSASSSSSAAPTDNSSTTPSTDSPIFRKHVNLGAEVRQLRRLQTSIRWYAKFVAKLQTATDRTRYALEVHVALEALNQLGEQCALHNFRAQAWQAFWVLLQLARRWPDADAAAQLAQLRAITHLAWSPADCAPLAEALCDAAAAASAREAQLAELRQHVELCADQWLPAMIAQYAALSRRKRGVLLHCLLSVALYYQEMGGASEARDMLRLAELQLERLEREFQLAEGNVYRMRYNAVLLKLIVRHRMECPYPPIVFAEQMMRQFGRLQWGMEDGITRLKCCLFDVLEDVRAYCVARHDVNEVVPVVQLMLKMSAKQGLAAASARMLVVWLQLELYMEKAAEADAVLRLLDDCLGIFDAGPAVVGRLQRAMAELAVGGGKQQQQQQQLGKKDEAELVGQQQQQQLGSPIRKAHHRRVSPIRESGAGVPCNKYLIANPGACAVSKQPIVQLLLFEAAILYCRTFYIKSEFAIAATMLEQTGQHFRAIIAPDQVSTDGEPSALFGSYADSYAQVCCRLFVDWAHSLWRAGQHDRAAEMLRSALQWWSRCTYPDLAVRRELNVQQMPLMVELASARKPVMVRKRFVDEVLVEEEENVEPAVKRAIQPAAGAVAAAGMRGRQPRSRTNKPPAIANGQRDKGRGQTESFAPVVVVTQPPEATAPATVVSSANRKRPEAPTTTSTSTIKTSITASRTTTKPKQSAAAICISDSDDDEEDQMSAELPTTAASAAPSTQSTRIVRQRRLRNAEAAVAEVVAAPAARSTRAKRRVAAVPMDCTD